MPEQAATTRAAAAAAGLLSRFLSDAGSHFVAIGTSGQVWPVAGWLALARRRGAATIVQALEAPENLDPGDEFRAGRAADVVPPIVETLLS